MGKIEQIMVHSKSTKRTEMYTAEVPYGEEPILDRQYVKNTAFREDGAHPEKITVIVEW